MVRWEGKGSGNFDAFFDATHVIYVDVPVLRWMNLIVQYCFFAIRFWGLFSSLFDETSIRSITCRLLVMFYVKLGYEKLGGNGGIITNY